MTWRRCQCVRERLEACAYSVVGQHLEEERGKHADCLLAGDVALVMGSAMTGGRGGTHDFGLVDEERVELFKLWRLADDLFGDIELPGEALGEPEQG